MNLNNLNLFKFIAHIGCLINRSFMAKFFCKTIKIETNNKKKKI